MIHTAVRRMIMSDTSGPSPSANLAGCTEEHEKRRQSQRARSTRSAPCMHVSTSYESRCEESKWGSNSWPDSEAQAPARKSMDIAFCWRNLRIIGRLHHVPAWLSADRAGVGEFRYPGQARSYSWNRFVGHDNPTAGARGALPRPGRQGQR
jgi:hypothetical protein